MFTEHHEGHWNHLQKIVSQLLERGYERNLLNALLTQVTDRRFDASLEFAYNHFKDVTNTDTDIVPEEIAKLCKEFLSEIDAIKNM